VDVLSLRKLFSASAQSFEDFLSPTVSNLNQFPYPSRILGDLYPDFQGVLKMRSMRAKKLLTNLKSSNKLLIADELK